MTGEMYLSGEYLEKCPTWHAEDASWKANHILKMMSRNNVNPKDICEIGCGAGGILAYLQHSMPEECMFSGYEISPQAFELCNKLANKRLKFKLMNILEDKIRYDLILLVDVIEHIEDYYSLLRGIKTKSLFKILHIPLELTVYNALRNKSFFDSRKLYGHIHYFTKDIALKILEETGYEVLDYFYTGTSIDLPRKSVKNDILNLVRKPFFSVHHDLAVRMLGGYSLMVLAR
jgi:cyclopropane fatty-acyl-phospholipid synthase-like methyltransferase